MWLCYAIIKNQEQVYWQKLWDSMIFPAFLFAIFVLKIKQIFLTGKQKASTIQIFILKVMPLVFWRVPNIINESCDHSSI